MKHAYVFPGQGAQAVGMGKDLYDNVPEAKELFEKANEILGFRITDIMFAGTDDELKQTKVTQPAVFLHSVIMAKALGVKPDAAAGHSLGEFSALVVAGALSFEDGLKLVSKRAMAMQAACEAQPGTMAAILGLEDHVVEEICASVDGIVVAANYNCPGQLVISGAVEAVDAACEKAKAAGARRALRLPVGGAFHSPLMEPAGLFGQPAGAPQPQQKAQRQRVGVAGGLLGLIARVVGVQCQRLCQRGEVILGPGYGLGPQDAVICRVAALLPQQEQQLCIKCPVRPRQRPEQPRADQFKQLHPYAPFNR